MSVLVTNFDTNGGRCAMCEHHSREAQAAKAEVLALKAELLEALPDQIHAERSKRYDMSYARPLPETAKERNLIARFKQLETELEESRKAGGEG